MRLIMKEKTMVATKGYKERNAGTLTKMKDKEVQIRSGNGDNR